MRQIILDTETTGLSPQQGHRIIEIGCIELVNRNFTDNHFHFYINPQRSIDIGAQKVHGISSEFLADKPLFGEIVQDFLAYIKGAEIIIHNAPFDVGFLNHEFGLFDKKIGEFTQHCQVIDTLEMARRLHPGQKNNLDALCKRYEINNAHRELHGALLDSQLLARVYLAMTGGQTSLFQQEATTVQQQATNATRKSLNRKDLTLCTPHANPEELKAHQQYVQFLIEKGGVNLWER